MNLKNALIAFTTAATVALAAGCATLEGDSEPAAKLAIQAGAAQYIDGNTERAEDVYRVSGVVLDLLDSEAEATMDLVEKRVRGEIDPNELQPAEYAVVVALIDTVRVEVNNRIDGGQLDPKERATVRKIVEWIRQTSVYAGAGDDTAS